MTALARSTLELIAEVRKAQACIAAAAQARPDLLPQPLHTGSTAVEARLTAKELQVLKGVCAGKQNKQICQEAALTDAGVKGTINRLYAKFEIQQRTRAALVGMVMANFANMLS